MSRFFRRSYRSYQLFGVQNVKKFNYFGISAIATASLGIIAFTAEENDKKLKALNFLNRNSQNHNIKSNDKYSNTSVVRLFDNYSVQELHNKYMDGSLTPLAYIKQQLFRLKNIDPRINPIAQFFDESQILLRAEQSTKRYSDKCPFGIFDGIPITVKDTTSSAVKGVVIHKGSMIRKQMTDQSSFTPLKSVPAIDVLLQQGAIILCKTTVPEMCWKGSCSSLLYGITCSPLNPCVTSGGSSGGAAALAALGIGCLHFGSDGGGSIRIPAACCGIYGHKPTFQFGLYPSFPSTSTIAPLTRYLDDIRIYMREVNEALYCKKRRQWKSLDFSKSNIESGVKGLRIAVSKDLDGMIDFVDDIVWESVLLYIEYLSENGAIVEFVDPPLSNIKGNPISNFLTAYSIMWYVCLYQGCRDYVCKENEHLVDGGILECMEKGENINVKQLLQALNYVIKVSEVMDEFMDDYDLVITPTLPTLPCKIQRVENDFIRISKVDGSGIHICESKHSLHSMTCLFNLTQQPAISLNCGYITDVESGGRTPIGLQIAGRRYGDDTVLRAAHVLQECSAKNGHCIFDGRINSGV